MIETLAYFFAIPGIIVILFLLMILVSHILDAKAARDYKRKIEEAKRRALTKPSWWPTQND